MIDNGATRVGFPTFTLLTKTNKEITLDSDLPFKDQYSQPDYTNLPNDFNNTNVRLIHEKADIPTISTEDSATYDLHSVEQVSIKPVDTNKINTSVNVHFPQTSFGFVTSRSSMSTNHRIMVPIGTLYRDYTRQISIVLHNQSKTTFSIKEGIHIAHLIII